MKSIIVNGIEAATLIPSSLRENPDFEKIGNRMLTIWHEGVDEFSAAENRRQVCVHLLAGIEPWKSSWRPEPEESGR